MTVRLYYTDSYLTRFEARIVERADEGRRVYLDRTAFYPTSGGQPFDTGTVGSATVIDVVDEGDRIAHVLEGPLPAHEDDEVAGVVEWERRFDHMQQHTGQHLLSAVFADLFGLTTVSVHFGAESASLDLDAESISRERLIEAETRANALVVGNRPITVTYEDAASAEALRKASTRPGTLRVVAIDGVDRSACGGTHVRLTGEIGPILLRTTDRVRRTTRVEFLCGGRAMRRARADYEAIAGIAQSLSAAVDDAPALVRAQADELQSAAAVRKRLEAELASHRARSLHASTTPDASGVRRTIERVALGGVEALRPLALAYCALEKAIFIGVAIDPPAVLLATSADCGVDAGARIKSLLASLGGRGGGSPRLAQGSLPSAEALESAVRALTAGADA